MRLQPLDPQLMDDELRSMHETMHQVAEQSLPGFIWSRPDGAMMGPFAPMLHWPRWGRSAWATLKALLETDVLPKRIHELVILVAGAAKRSDFELYAHQRVAESVGLPRATISTVVAGQRPRDLDAAEAAAYDLAAGLVRGGAVPEATYGAAAEALGEEGTAAVIYLVAGYTSFAVLLNGYATPVPEDDAR